MKPSERDQVRVARKIEAKSRKGPTALLLTIRCSILKNFGDLRESSFSEERKTKLCLLKNSGTKEVFVENTDNFLEEA